MLTLTKVPNREQTFCPGCPHRASFWVSIMPCSWTTARDLCAVISAAIPLQPCPRPRLRDSLKRCIPWGQAPGVASGFGKLGQFGLDQPVLAVSGDSTFYHAVIPALINAVHHKSNITLVVLDNSGTAMTGFQSHPGLRSMPWKRICPRSI